MEPVEKMTVDHFPITQQHNGWLITWPGFSNIRLVENKQKLADLVFDSIGVEQARFGVRLDNSEIKFLHIRFNDWAADRSGYLADLLDRYEIASVLFDSEASARWLQDYFEKKLIWKRLSQTA
jgi:hypothetical protein